MSSTEKPPQYFTLITEIREGVETLEFTRAMLHLPNGKVVNLSHKDKAWLNRFGYALVKNGRGRYLTRYEEKSDEVEQTA